MQLGDARRRSCYYKLYLGELRIGGEAALNLRSGYRPNYVLLERDVSCVLHKKKKRLGVTNTVRMFSSSPEERSQVEPCDNPWSQTSADAQGIH